MNHTAPIHEPAIRSIPLDRLYVALENVRKTPPDAVAEAELKASIANHGLLENLVVRSEGLERAYAVVAGGRRLAALKALAADGVLDTGHPVPCLVVDGNASSSELSLAENVIRIAMHPADQVIAFTKLTESGVTAAAIAARFGTSERLVEQRLRLGNAAPELLNAYRAGEIDLETLKAFTVTTDHSRQMAVWEQVADQGYRPAAWQVKRMLTEERVPANSAIARFVGIEDYEAAGGPVLRDLFAAEDESGIWLEDPVLLQKLAMEKLGETVKDLETRWRWATAAPEVDWTEIARYGRISPEPCRTDPRRRPPSWSACAPARTSSPTSTRKTGPRSSNGKPMPSRPGPARSTRRSRPGQPSARRTARWRAPSPLSTGGATFRSSRVWSVPRTCPSRQIPATATAVTPVTTATTADDRVRRPAISAPIASPADPQAEARKEAGVGIGLSDDLRSIRTALVKAHLGENFEAAFDLMLFQLGRAVFTHGYQEHPLDIAVRETPDRPTLRMNDEDFGAWSPGEEMLADRSSLPLDWLTIEDGGESFAALRALPQDDKQRLFAATVARTVKGQLAFEPQARPELEATIARLDVDFASHVRPTADMLWSRINKGRILDIARETLGPAWASARAKSKKPAIAKAMEEAFAAASPPLGVTADAHAAALAWTPPGFKAFDAGRADAEDVSAETAPPADTTDSVAGPAPEDTGAPEPVEPEGADAPVDPPHPVSVAETVEAPAVAEHHPAPIAANGHDNGNGLDIPEFLRNV